MSECRSFALFGAMTLAACSFKGGGNPGSDPDAAVEPDGPIVGTDANPICDPLELKLQIDGEDLTDFATAIPVAVGDSINLNAGRSCSPTGNINFTWAFNTEHFVPRETALNQFVIDVYPDDVSALTISITVDDGGGSPITQAIPIVGVGFTALDFRMGVPTAIEEMEVSPTRLWLATDAGAFSQDLGTLTTRPYPLVNDDANAGTPTDPIPTLLSDVSYDADNEVVAFLPADGSAAYFFDQKADNITSYTSAELDVGNLIDSYAIGGGGVRLLNTVFAESSPDYTTFTRDWNRDTSAIIFDQGADVLAAGFALFRFVDLNNSEPLEIFNQGMNDDDGIVTAFVDADGALWLGSSLGIAAETGIGVIDNFDDATVETHLLGQVIREIDQEAAGDMWVATATGVMRFKADWNRWIALNDKHGLADVDSRALIVNQGATRTRILVGTATDLFVLVRP